jgi:hypothetical protein
MGGIFKYLFYLVATLSVFGCKKDNHATEVPYLLFPAGRSFLGSSEINVYINDIEFKPDTIFDSCGGYWFKIPKAVLPSSGKVYIQYTRKKGEITLFKKTSEDNKDWTCESNYIDCNNNKIKNKAIELTKNYRTNIDKAKQIQNYVISHLRLNIYKNSFLENASRTDELGYGTCMNFSRLFVALCRSVNIPARSVWGILYGYNNDNIYDYHHQWAEISDESGYWHQADFTYTTNFDLNDIRYLDLIYAAEENSMIKNRISDEIKIGNVEYFNNYPASLSGRLGFELQEDARPDYMIVKYIYEF